MPNIPATWRPTQTVNTTTAGTQSRPHVTQLTNGNLVVVWATSEAGGTAFIARLFDPTGNAIGGELFRQYLTPDDNFTFPDVVAGPNGTFVTSYMDGNTTSVFINTWDSSGNPVGGSPAVLDSAGSNPNFANPVIGFSNSNPNRVLLVAEQLSPAGSTIVARLRTTAGDAVAGSLTTLFDFAGGVVDPAVATLTVNGNFVIAATHLQAGDSRIVYRVISGTTGAAIAGPFEITGTAANGRTDSEASVSALAGGGFVIAWRSSNGTDSNIEYRTYSSAGSQTAAGSIGAGANDNLHDATVIPLADGSFIIAYDNDLNLVQQATHISSAGVLLGTFAYGGNGGDGDAIGLADGRFATVWIDATGEISLAILDTRDSPNTRIGEGIVAGTIGNDVITADYGRTYGGLGDDEITLKLDYYNTPSANGGDGSDTLVLSGQNYTVVDLAAGTVKVEYFNGSSVFYVTQSATNFENLRYSGTADLGVAGTSGDNIIATGSGTDSLLGMGGNDTLNGGTGADTMSGGSGSDLYIVDNAGDRVFEGVAGIVDTDTVNAYVSWTMAAGQEIERLRAGPGTDPINLTGNEFGQKLVGNNGANTLTGGGGNDNIQGGGGADILIGGSGLDKLTGGDGADIFVMQIGGELDRIVDFTAGTDKIDLRAFGMTFQQVLAATTESGGTATITLGNSDLIQLVGVTKASLSIGDFLLAGSSGGSAWIDTLEGELWNGDAAQIAASGPHFLATPLDGDMWHGGADWYAM